MKSERPEMDRCNICGVVNRLSEDHVPPKFWNNKSLKRYSIAFGAKDPAGATHSFPYKDRKGITYKSICAECNSKLGGSYDKELQKFCDTLAKCINSKLYIRVISTTIKPDRVARAVVGHILAAKNFFDDECIIDKRLRKYMEDESNNPPENMYLYCYPYYHRSIIVGRDMVVLSRNIPEGMISMISSFPVAFLLTEKKFPGMKDIFELCTGNVDTEKKVAITEESAYEYGTNSLKNPLWPINIGGDVSGVMGGKAIDSMIIATGKAQ